MSAIVFPFSRPNSAAEGDWSQHELAEFYRVEAVALRAGLRLSLERGVTDEGDPWIIFCREDGDVFLHFARVDRSYVIVTDMVDKPLVGPDFRSLLVELVARNPNVLPLIVTSSRSGAQIRMHPAALLAAIVVTACLLSSMTEAVAGELDVASTKSPPASREPLGSLDLVASVTVLKFDARDDEASDQTRVSQRREFAFLASVAMSCISAFGDGSSSALAHGQLFRLDDDDVRAEKAAQALVNRSSEPVTTVREAAATRGDGQQIPVSLPAVASERSTPCILEASKAAVPTSMSVIIATGLEAAHAPLPDHESVAAAPSSAGAVSGPFPAHASAGRPAAHDKSGSAAAPLGVAAWDAALHFSGEGTPPVERSAPESPRAAALSALVTVESSSAPAIPPPAPSDDRVKIASPPASSTALVAAAATTEIIAPPSSDHGTASATDKPNASILFGDVSTMSAKTVSLLLHHMIDHSSTVMTSTSDDFSASTSIGMGAALAGAGSTGAALAGAGSAAGGAPTVDGSHAAKSLTQKVAGSTMR